MPFRSVIQPDQIAMLTRVLDAHCEKFGIRSEEGRQSVAASILAHYQTGVTNDRELARLVEREDRPEAPIVLSPSARS